MKFLTMFLFLSLKVGVLPTTAQAQGSKIHFKQEKCVSRASFPFRHALKKAVQELGYGLSSRANADAVIRLNGGESEIHPITLPNGDEGQYVLHQYQLVCESLHASGVAEVSILISRDVSKIKEQLRPFLEQCFYDR